MNKVLKINAIGFTAFLVVLCLLFNGVTIANLGFNLRPIHILLPWLAIMAALFPKKLLGSSLVVFLRQRPTYLFMAYLAIPIVLYVGPNSLKLLAGIFFNVFLALLFYGIFKDRSISLTSLFKMAYYSTVFLAGVMVLQFFLSALGIYKPHMYGIDGFFLLGRPAAFFGDPGWLAYWIILFSLLVYYFYRIGRLNVTSFYFFLFLLLLAVFINQSRVTLLFLLVNYFLVVLKNKTERKFFFGFFSP